MPYVQFLRKPLHYGTFSLTYCTLYNQVLLEGDRVWQDLDHCHLKFMDVYLIKPGKEIYTNLIITWG